MARDGLQVREVSDRELQITLASRFELIRELRRQLKAFAAQKGFTEEEVFEAQLAVNEAVANVIKHAYRGEEKGRIDLHVNLDEEGNLVITIRDFGAKADPVSFQSRDLDDFREGGIGIYLMRNLMDEVTYDHSPETGTILTMKKLKKPGSKQPE